MISLAVAAAGWVGLVHPEITPHSNFHHLRDTTSATLEELTTRWPDFTGTNLPRPAVVAITRQDGMEVAS